MEKQWQELLDVLKKLSPNLDLPELNRLLQGLNNQKEADGFRSLLEKVGNQNDLQGLLNKLKNTDLQTVFGTIKKLGFQTEFKLNENIQQTLNKKELIKLLHKYAHIITPLFEGLKEIVETLSVPLNFPTKNDVANVAKLILQNEEKLDSIEEQLLILNQHLKELIGDQEIPSNKKSKPKKETAKREELKKIKRLKLMNYLMESTSNHLNRKE